MKYYFLLLIIRFTFIYSPGYIHPDEFYQSYQIAINEIYENNLAIPWEYNKDLLSRSLVPILLNMYPPLLSLRTFTDISNPIVLFLLPRLYMFIMSIFIDYFLYKICENTNRDGKIALLIQNTSWVSILFFTRCFSNTLELMLIYFVMYLVTKRNLNTISPLIGSIAIVLGLFVRITFVAFALPLLIYLFYRLYQFDAMIKTKKIALTFVLKCFIYGFFATAGCILIDSQYANKLVVAPLNNLLYNADPKNLQLHGLHPRYLHLVVNLQLLFGPMFILVAAKTKKFKKYILINMMILIPLITLSIFPHQEPRFLIPLLLPLTLLALDYNIFKNKFVVVVWILFNVILLIFYGILHQGGVIPIGLKLDRLIQNETVYTYKTLLMPDFLSSKNKIVNLNDGTDIDFTKVEYIICSPEYIKKISNAAIILFTYFPHLSTDNFDSTLQLNVYKL